MKLVIFTRGLSEEELRALDVLYSSVQPHKEGDFFCFHGADERVVFVCTNDDGSPVGLTYGSHDYGMDQLLNNKQKVKNVQPKFEYTVVATVPPLVIKMHGCTYQLMQE